MSNYIYDPYGVVEQQSGSQYNPWQFAGGYYDATTLYEKFGTRYYDRFGRWTQQDPVPSANPYVYANDDPVNLVDPSGRCTPGELALTIIIAVGSALVITGLLVALAPELVGVTGLLAQLLVIINSANGLQLIGSILVGIGSAGLAGACLSSVLHGGN